MQRNFELETILSVTTGINHTDDFGKVYDLASYVFSDDTLSPLAIGILKDDLRNHLLTIHPELKDVRCTCRNRLAWVEKQKINFGSELAVSKLGMPLNEKGNARKKCGI